MKKDIKKLITWAEINLGAARRNFSLIKKKVGENVTVAAVVKADAYSHGALRLAKAFLLEGAKFLAVAAADEGIELRSSGINIPIIIFNPILPEEIDKILEYGLTSTVDNLKICELLDERNRVNGYRKKVMVHVEVDTGMGRSRLCPDKAVSEIGRITALKNLIVEGIYTHFPSAEDDREFTVKQIAEFKRLITELEKAGIEIPFKHCANSAGILAFPESYFNMVRPGLCLYGISPFVHGMPGDTSCALSRPAGIDLEPVLTLKSRIVHKQEAGKGRTFSYGRTFTVTRKSHVAILPIGYADGYDRRLSNKAEVLIKGKRAPVVGRICMDRCHIDVTDIPGAEVGDEAVLVGKQNSTGKNGKQQSISIEELSRKAQTIPHELISRIGKRVYRYYVNK